MASFGKGLVTKIASWNGFRTNRREGGYALAPSGCHSRFSLTVDNGRDRTSERVGCGVRPTRSRGHPASDATFEDGTTHEPPSKVFEDAEDGSTCARAIFGIFEPSSARRRRSIRAFRATVRRVKMPMTRGTGPVTICAVVRRPAKWEGREVPDIAADADRKIESVEPDNGHWYTLSNVCSRGRMETSRARPLVARPGLDSSPEKPDARASLIDRGDGDVRHDGNYGTTHGWLRRGDQTAGAGDVSALLGTVCSRADLVDLGTRRSAGRPSSWPGAPAAVFAEPVHDRRRPRQRSALSTSRPNITV